MNSYNSIMTREAAEFWWNIPIKGIERKPFIVPKNVIHYSHNIKTRKWEAWTWEDEFKKRKAKQKAQLHYNRQSHEPIKKPALIHVFSSSQSGWYIYILTLKEFYSIYYYRNGWKHELVLKIMRDNPCGVIPIYENIDVWCENFTKLHSTKSFLYPTKEFYFKPKRGVLKCWIEIDNNKTIKILKYKH